MLSKTISANNQYEGMEVIDWEKKIREHILGIEKEERELEERQNKAAGKRASWELLRMCKSYIMENSKNWKETEKRKEEGEEK